MTYRSPGVRPAGLAGIGVAAALAMAAPQIMRWEGKRTVTYRDLAGVPTACYGHAGRSAGPVGTRWTDVQCAALLDRDIRDHMNGVLTCVPDLAGRPRQLAAATSLAFNIGTGAFCRSTAARRFRQGDWRGGCEAFRRWNRVDGQVVRGLANRRESERAQCLTEL